MKSRAQRMTAVAGVILTACLAPDGARPQDLHGSVALYGWLPGLDAEITSTRGGVSASTSVSARDVLEALNFAFMANAQVNYGRFGLIQDVVYSDLGTSGDLSGPLNAQVNIDTNMVISMTAVAYRVYDKDGWSIEPYAGARYVGLKQDVKITGGGPLGVERAASVDLDWWEPVIGLRGEAPITASLSAIGFADIGGFGAGSELSWEIYAGLDYAFTDSVSAVEGFRYLSINYEADRADLKLDTYGPVLGAKLLF